MSEFDPLCNWENPDDRSIDQKLTDAVLSGLAMGIHTVIDVAEDVAFVVDHLTVGVREDLRFLAFIWEENVVKALERR